MSLYLGVFTVPSVTNFVTKFCPRARKDAPFLNTVSLAILQPMREENDDNAGLSVIIGYASRAGRGDPSTASNLAPRGLSGGASWCDRRVCFCLRVSRSGALFVANV